ncbi:DgyrCDS12917 [Dimorphilus gyrociliatus]|uniref:DgyrCDS12917 n=1 Tax=Dimorphilus gyrociliatus TaxID=2664684 RepID=A0A7I8W953_9ANNE|nr:DgyrCDS12917 [Dimorphilus gyrociliatus]
MSLPASLKRRASCQEDIGDRSPDIQDMDKQRKIRRQIANNNERRRMQSINAGFESLRTMLPLVDEKMSKAGILQRTKDYLNRLLQERTNLKKENEKLLGQLSHGDSPPQKRRKRDTSEALDESLPSDYRQEFEEERRKRKELEEENRELKNRLLEPSKPPERVVDSSMSSRNIQTIIAAINYLEGDKFEDCSTNRGASEESEASSEGDLSGGEEYDATLRVAVYPRPSLRSS